MLSEELKVEYHRRTRELNLYLSKRKAQILALSEMGLSTHQISVELNITQGAVASQLQIARAELRDYRDFNRPRTYQLPPQTLARLLRIAKAEPDLSVSSLAARFHLSKARISAILTEHGVRK
jgi:DNA-binding CsgD family transcriptional regulator